MLSESQVGVLSLRSGERQLLLQGGTSPRYSPTGHLVYAVSGSLLAAPFDVERLELTGEAIVVANGVSVPSGGANVAHFDLSENGSLVFLSDLAKVARDVVWVDRQGREEPLNMPPLRYRAPRLSPNGTQLAVEVEGDSENDVDIHIYDLRRGTLTPFTFDPGLERDPLWTVDGQRVVFRMTTLDGGGGLFSKAASGTGQVERLVESALGQALGSFSPNGDLLVFDAATATSGRDIQVLSLGEDEPTVRPLIATPFQEVNPKVSPNGRWLAFSQDMQGQREVFVRPFPNVDDGSGWQITRSGGTFPRWAADGRELFYYSQGRIVAVEVETESGFAFGNAEIVAGEAVVGGGREYDVDVDGQRFVMVKDLDGRVGLSEINLIMNWTQELLERVPVN